MGEKNPDGVIEKETGAPIATAAPGVGVDAVSFAAAMTVIVLVTVAVAPSESEIVTVMLCDPMWSLFGVQEKFPP